MLILSIIGIAMIVTTAKKYYRIFVGLSPIEYFPFIDGKYAFESKYPGNYGIIVKNAGNIKEIKPVTITIISPDLTEINAAKNFIAPRIYVEGKESIQYWNYSTEQVGRFEIEFSNLEHVEAKKGVSFPFTLFQDELEHKSIALAIQKCDKPLTMLAVFLVFMCGVVCIILAALMLSR